MAKGLGAIMASVDLARKQERLEAGEALLCPICGTEMEAEGGSYFCYAWKDPKSHRETIHPCVTSTHSHVKEAYLATHDDWGAEDAWQHQVLAAVVDASGDTPKILAELRTVRGPNAKTNMRASVEYDSGYSEDYLPELVRKYGWTFMDWVPLENNEA